MTRPTWLGGGCGRVWCTHRISAPACCSGAQDKLKCKARGHMGVVGMKEPLAERGHDRSQSSLNMTGGAYN